MKTLHFDLSAGISGDMCLGALVHLGADREILQAELEKLGLSGWKLDFFDDERGGIHGLHARVELESGTDHVAHDDDHDAAGDATGGAQHHHAHRHDHEHHHDHGHGHTHDHTEEPHRTWRDIRTLIENSGIREGAKKRALDIFSRIAQAEAEVHNCPVEEIAFHEVGALDSIIDVTGSAVCLDLLNPGRITAGEMELGGGMVRCAHGLLPVPAPAVLVLCRGLPVRTGGFDREMTTPTGAAIIAASVDEFVSTASFREIRTGYGTGTRRMKERPNLLRVSLREETAAGAGDAGWRFEELVLMETDIDDMSGEALGFLMERLFDAGALDVAFTPRTMKKSRPGTSVSVLAPPEKLAVLRRTLFVHSSTIGFRETPVRRISLEREAETLRGGFGEVRTKTVFMDGKPLRSKVEFDDRARTARERGISLAEAERLLGDSR